jgi:hypothetical protein
MAFWSAIGAEPKRNNKWVIRFSPPGMSSISYALKKADKPKSKIGEVSHKYLNHTFWYPGRLEWEPINVAFAATSEPDATFIINQVTLLAGYGVPNNPGLTPDQLATIGKNKFRGALGSSIDIYQIDANGMTSELWQLFNPFFTNIQYGSLDYSNEEIVEISTTIRFDWAKLTAPTSEAGQATDAPDFGNRPAGGGIFP